MKKTEVSGSLDKITFGYMGTEIIDIQDLLKLTDGRSLEIRAEGVGIKLTLHVMPGPFKHETKGSVSIEYNETAHFE